MKPNFQSHLNFLVMGLSLYLCYVWTINWLYGKFFASTKVKPIFENLQILAVNPVNSWFIAGFQISSTLGLLESFYKQSSLTSLHFTKQNKARRLPTSFVLLSKKEAR